MLETPTRRLVAAAQKMGKGSTNKRTPKSPGFTEKQVFVGACLGIAALHLLLFFVSCVLLVSQASTVDSPYAQQALKDHGLYIVLSSLGLTPPASRLPGQRTIIGT